MTFPRADRLRSMERVSIRGALLSVRERFRTQVHTDLCVIMGVDPRVLVVRYLIAATVDSVLVCNPLLERSLLPLR